MPHSEVSTNLESQVNLLGTINTKVSADGAGGPLVAYLAEQGIVLANDVAKGVTVTNNYTIYLADSKTSQDFREQRDAIMIPIEKRIIGCVQFLKGFFQPNYKSLGDWGITAEVGGKITLPATEEEWQTLIEAINTKNSSYIFPLISPLQQYLNLNNIILANDITNFAAAMVKSASMASAKVTAEDAHKLVVKDWAIPLSHIRLIVAFLMKLYAGKAKKLGYYGITVVNTPKVQKTRNIKLSITENKLRQEAELGSVLVNMGTGSLNIYKGKTITSTPTALAAGEKLLLVKGYSTFSVQNPSSVIKGILQIIPKAIAAKKS